ncbi:hypothetical protein HA48_13430 [Pantoea wallisii]|uniref:Uncharacterized protein n=1 Tax=Pantoea wallisii TaxID=1076551 RepID=A0A1X1D7M2_9GAMM|nr:hypothetical protein HA48_13430 [Pantoea wallisii]
MTLRGADSQIPAGFRWCWPVAFTMSAAQRSSQMCLGGRRVESGSWSLNSALLQRRRKVMELVRLLLDLIRVILQIIVALLQLTGQAH